MEEPQCTPPRLDPLAPRTALVQKYDGTPLYGDELPHGITRQEVRHWNDLLRKASSVELICEVCMKTFTAKRRDAVCCSARCRKNLERARNYIETAVKADTADLAKLAESEEYRLWQVATRPKAPHGVNDWDHMLSLNEARGDSHNPPPWADTCTCLSCQLSQITR